MPLLVNGETVPPDLISAEVKRLRAHPSWSRVGDKPGSEAGLEAEAERSAINQILFRQAADLWDFPIDEDAIAAARTKLIRSSGLRSCSDPRLFRSQAIAQLRGESVLQALAGHLLSPPKGEAKRFYRANTATFALPERVRVAHVHKKIDESNTEEAARSAIDAAEAELRSGSPFSVVVERYSDCKDNGGEIELFPLPGVS